MELVHFHLLFFNDLELVVQVFLGLGQLVFLALQFFEALVGLQFALFELGFNGLNPGVTLIDLLFQIGFEGEEFFLDLQHLVLLNHFGLGFGLLQRALVLGVKDIPDRNPGDRTTSQERTNEGEYV